MSYGWFHNNTFCIRLREYLDYYHRFILLVLTGLRAQKVKLYSYYGLLLYYNVRDPGTKGNQNTGLYSTRIQKKQVLYSYYGFFFSGLLKWNWNTSSGLWLFHRNHIRLNTGLLEHADTGFLELLYWFILTLWFPLFRDKRLYRNIGLESGQTFFLRMERRCCYWECYRNCYSKWSWESCLNYLCYWECRLCYLCCWYCSFYCYWEYPFYLPKLDDLCTIQTLWVATNILNFNFHYSISWLVIRCILIICFIQSLTERSENEQILFTFQWFGDGLFLNTNITNLSNELGAFIEGS